MFTNQLIVSLFWSLKPRFDCCLFDILHRKYVCMFTVLLKQQLDHHIPAVTRFCNAFSNKHFQENRTILVCQADMLRYFCSFPCFFSVLCFSVRYHPFLCSSTSLLMPQEYKGLGFWRQGVVWGVHILGTWEDIFRKLHLSFILSSSQFPRTNFLCSSPKQGSWILPW